MKRALVLASLVVLLLPITLLAKDSKDSGDSRDSLVRFAGGIGVHPISNVTVTPNPSAPPTIPAINVARNTVRTVDPAGQIWVIANLRANIKNDGRIRVEGEGLLLAGGNNIGLNAGASVFATLICEAVAPFTLHNTTLTGVPLAANGDFRIDDLLSPAPPAVCASPVLLIRNAANGGWFAAGIQKLDHD